MQLGNYFMISSKNISIHSLFTISHIRGNIDLSRVLSTLCIGGEVYAFVIVTWHTNTKKFGLLKWWTTHFYYLHMRWVFLIFDWLPARSVFPKWDFEWHQVQTVSRRWILILLDCPIHPEQKPGRQEHCNLNR